MCEHNFLSKSWEALIGYCLTYNNKIKAPSAKEVSSLKVIIPFCVSVRQNQCKLIINIKKQVDIVPIKIRMTTDKKAPVFWNFDRFLGTETAKKLTFKHGSSLVSRL